MHLAFQPLVGAFLLVCLLASCSGGGGPAARCDQRLPQEWTWRDPLYPAAQHIQPDPQLLSTATPTSHQKTLFDTNDSPQAVQTFYRQGLTQAGWVVDALPTQAPGELNFTIANCCAYGWLRVTTTVQPAGPTRVSVEHGWGMGCG